MNCTAWPLLIVFRIVKVMKVLIADDHSVLREGVKRIVSQLPDVSNIEEACNGGEALSRLEAEAYDLMVLDITMPDMNGLDVLKYVRDKGIPTRTIILSLHPEDEYASRSFKLGAVGYIAKSSTYSEITEAIKKVAAGGRYVSPDFAEKLAFDSNTSMLPHERLSDREFQVMLLLAKGGSVSQIADQTMISDKTVSTYRSRIMQKMGLKRNAEITMYAVRNNLLVS